MDHREFVDTRRKRYLAQTLEEFEQTVEPLLDEFEELLSSDQRIRLMNAINAHKANVRRKFGALATDASDVLPQEVNPAAIEIRDNLSTRRS